MRHTAILFDLDDTLIPDIEESSAAFVAVCELARARYGVEPESLARAVKAHARALWRSSTTHAYCKAIGISSSEGLCASFEGDDPNLRTLREWSPTYRKESWLGALRLHGVDDTALADELAGAFAVARLARCAPFPEVENCLETLRSRFGLGMITNGAPDLQWEKIRRSGLERYFDTIVVSGDLGIGKPEPDIFTHTLQRMNTTSSAAAMVGNSLTRDIAGARGAGVYAVWMNRAKEPLLDGVVPDAEITNLETLPAVLNK